MAIDPRPQSTKFKLANFLDVDSSDDPAAYIAFLDRFSADFREMINTGIDLLRLQPGSAVLDVGCGHGAVIPMLAARVGPTGSVTGIDLSNELVAEAHLRLDAAGLPVKIRVGNAQATDFADATFDATRADRVLAYVPNPRTAVFEFARVTRAGGHVVITEPDLGASMLDSPDVDTTRAVLAGISDEFPNGWMGRQLRALFLDAGLINVELQFFTLLNTNLTEWSRRFGIDDALLAAVVSNRVSSVRAEAWLEDLRRRDATGRFLSSSTMCMVAGTKSEHGD